MGAAETSLRSEPLFLRWVAAEGISLLGSSVTTVVLPLVVYESTGSAGQTGLLFAVRVVPYLLFGLIAGPLADRGNRRFLIRSPGRSSRACSSLRSVRPQRCGSTRPASSPPPRSSRGCGRRSADRIHLISPTCVIVSSVLVAGMSITGRWLVAGVLILLFSLTISTTIMVNITYRQLVAPDELRSSVNVLGRMISWGGQPFGAAIGALVASTASVAAAYGVAAALMLATGIWAVFALRAAVTAPAVVAS